MWIFLIFMIILFDVLTCILQIPEMLKMKQYREFVIFSAFLLIGTVFGILRCCSLDIANPSDLISFIYSPISDLLQSIMR